MLACISHSTFTTLQEHSSPFSESRCFVSSDTEVPAIGHCEQDALCAASTTKKLDNLAKEDLVEAVKHFSRNFLTRLPYLSPHTVISHELRREVAAEIVSWDVGLSPEFITGLTETSCVIAQSAYPHTSYEHQRFVAIYTACLTYIDDLGKDNLETIAQFAQRFSQGEQQQHPALDRLMNLLGTVYQYYPRVSADLIITSTIEFFTAMYVELVSGNDVIAPSAAKYPYYLRIKTGIAPAYAHFNFTKSWGESAGNYYLQVLPELELVTIGINDILSFYKETLAGERDNYLHMRAVAEQKSPLLALRELVEEVLDSIRKIKDIGAAQPGLAEICWGFIQGYVEFHFLSRRYRLVDLNVEED